MESILSTFFKISTQKSNYDDDFVDRISRQYSVFVFILFGVIVSAKQFIGDPISCWVPAYFTPSHREYANNICWVSRTYYVPFDDPVPADSDFFWEQHKRISYYQWVPLIMLFNAFLCVVPRGIWNFLVSRSGINIGALVETALMGEKGTYLEVRKKAARFVVHMIDRFLMTHRNFSRGCCFTTRRVISHTLFCCGGKKQGNYLTFSYIIVKFLYLANAIGQLFLLGYVLDTNFYTYGFYSVLQISRGQDVSESQSFPRVTLCNFKVRHQGRIHDYVVQCAMPINLFNEIIFIIIWFWLVLVAVTTFCNSMLWLIRVVHWPVLRQYARKKVRPLGITKEADKSFDSFVEAYLRRDGLLLIRLLSINSGKIMAAEVLADLWENYTPEKDIILNCQLQTRRASVDSI